MKFENYSNSPKKGCGMCAGTFPHKKLKDSGQVFKNVNPKDEQYWIFLNAFNSFIFISAQKADLKWKETSA